MFRLLLPLMVCTALAACGVDGEPETPTRAATPDAHALIFQTG